MKAVALRNASDSSPTQPQKSIPEHAGRKPCDDEDDDDDDNDDHDDKADDEIE